MYMQTYENICFQQIELTLQIVMPKKETPESSLTSVAAKCVLAVTKITITLHSADPAFKCR